MNKKLTLLTLLFTLISANIYSMETKTKRAEEADAVESQQTTTISKTKLDTLPVPVISAIIKQLIYTTGSSHSNPEEDLKIALKNLARLRLTNKQLYAATHHELIISMLIKAVAHKFNISPVAAAAKLKSPEARAWLKRYVHASGDYEQFKIVQQILAIRDDLIKEAKTLEFEIGTDDHEPNCFYNSTQQGFFLEAGSMPQELYTPWGQLKLYHGSYGGGWNKSIGFLSQFLSNFTWKFEQRSGGGYDTDRPKFYEVTKPCDMKTAAACKSEELCTPITQDAIKQKQGTATIILSNRCGYNTVYRLTHLGKTQLPEASMAKSQRYDYGTAHALWEIMKEEFNKSAPAEQSPAKKLKLSPAQETKASAAAEKSYPAGYKPVPSTPIKTINDIPELCIKLVKQLDAQPLFTGGGMIADTGKALALESWDECKICEEMVQKANKLLQNDGNWHVHTMGCGNNQLYVDNHCIGNGLQQWIYPGYPHGSIELLHKTLRAIIEDFKQGWQAATLKDFPTILHKQSEEEWYLFVNKNFTDATLIRFMASALSINELVSCYNNFERQKDSAEIRDTIYLWIRKDAFEEVSRVFDLKLTPKVENLGNRFKRAVL